MESIRLFLISISLLIVGFLIYPIAMDLLTPSLNMLIISENTSIFEKIIYQGLPLIIVFAIILYSIGGGLSER